MPSILCAEALQPHNTHSAEELTPIAACSLCLKVGSPKGQQHKKPHTLAPTTTHMRWLGIK